MNHEEELSRGLIWPDFICNEFRNLLGVYWRSIRRKGGIGLIRNASWEPWTLLSKSQAFWMLGRLSDAWVEKKIHSNSITAWDDGGAFVVWEMAIEACKYPENSAFAEAFIPTLRRYIRQLGGRPKKIVFGTGSNVVIDLDTLQEVGESALECLFLDYDFEMLTIGPDKVLASPQALVCECMRTPTEYYRCPIPEKITPDERDWAWLNVMPIL